jgi:hypothetical protein
MTARSLKHSGKRVSHIGNCGRHKERKYDYENGNKKSRSVNCGNQKHRTVKIISSNLRRIKKNSQNAYRRNFVVSDCWAGRAGRLAAIRPASTASLGEGVTMKRPRHAPQSRQTCSVRGFPAVESTNSAQGVSE